MYNYGKVVNIYIVYETSKNNNISSYSTLENVKVKLVKFLHKVYTYTVCSENLFN